jgi:ABC-2 type transport system ATP-binding protein
MSSPLIDIRNLRYTLGSHAVLRDVSLQLEQGSSLGLIGRTGAGKTTLLRCMLGLAFPKEGSARLFDETAVDLSKPANARLGYVPQAPNLPGSYTVIELAELIDRWQPHWDSGWAIELLRRFDLPGKRRVSALSAGQQQLLALVLALGHKPDLLVLDEPVASLDPVTRRTVVATLAELQADRGTSIVFSTHVLSDLERLASHVAVLHDGRIELYCEADDIRGHLRKWLLTSNSPLPESLKQQGVLRYRKTSSGSAILLVDSRQGPRPEEMPGTVDEHALGLEDFVVEYLQ